MVTLTKPPETAQRTADMINHQPTRIAPNRFKIEGREGDVYIIIVNGDQANCNCQAGWKDRYCWHCEKVRRQVETEQDTANIELAIRGNRAYARVQELIRLGSTTDAGFYVRQQYGRQLNHARAELAECREETEHRRQAGTWRRPAQRGN